MNIEFSGSFFDGETLAAKVVTLRPSADDLQISGAGQEQNVAVANVRVSDRLGAVPRYLYLPNGCTIETADNNFVDAWLAGQKRGRLVALLHWLELRSKVAATATVLLVAVVAVTIGWALPVLARRAAMAVPASVEAQAGQAALLTLNRILSPTQLDFADKVRVQNQLDRLVKTRGLPIASRLEFRSTGGKTPNAFALPGGIIVVTDELVLLATRDEELAAVLAHEMGHWQNRHGLQSILRGSSALLVVSTVTGDLSTLTTFAGTIPFLLLQRGYSREFEAEADAYAMDLLRAARIDPRHFASILKKLEDSRPTSGADFTYLSTHPATAERIKAIDFKAVNPAPVEKAPVIVLEKIIPSQPNAAGAKPGKDITAGLTLLPGQTSPRPLYQTPPVYPPEMAASSTEGDVTVEFIVDNNGDTRELRVVRSTRKEFEGAAVAAVSQWKFVPGQIRGRNIATRISQKLVFALGASPNAPSPAMTPESRDFQLKH